jgi:hypothetical protein
VYYPEWTVAHVLVERNTEYDMGKLPSRQRPVFTMRLAVAERRIIEAAAASRTEYLSEYIRRAALEAARRDLTNGDDAAR